MEETLTIPRRDPLAHAGRSPALAGIGTLACAGQVPGVLDAAFSDYLAGNSPTGANIEWLARSLVNWDRQLPTNHYARSIEAIRSVNGEIEFADEQDSDRDMLLYIKDVLSLTGQQLAAAMGVSRTSLYQWLDGGTTMRDKSRSRLSALTGLADFWSERMGGTLARSPGVGGGERSRLAKLLAAKSPRGLKDARSLLESLAVVGPAARPMHRSVLEIMKERGWKRIPDHVRRAEMESRLPSVKSDSEPD